MTRIHVNIKNSTLNPQLNSDKDIHWIQRFQNFDRAFLLLRSALEERGLEQMSELEKEGLIRRFKYSYELARQTIKGIVKLV